MSRNEEYFVSLYFHKIMTNINMAESDAVKSKIAIVYLDYDKELRHEKTIKDANNELVRVFSNLGFDITITYEEIIQDNKIYKAKVEWE